MDSIAASSGLTPLLRPAVTLHGDLPSVLREGRILSGEVLQTLDGGSVLIGVGQHRVPADAHVELQPGRRFLFQVESRNGELVMRLLGGAGGVAGSALLAAIRALAGEELPVGRLLVELVDTLRGSSQERVDALRAEVERLAFPSLEGGEGLRSSLARPSLGYHAVVLAALDRSGVGGVSEALGRLAAAIRARLATVAASGRVPLAAHGFESEAPAIGTLRTIQTVVARALEAMASRTLAGPLDARALVELTRAFERAFASALGSHSGERARSALLAAVGALEPGELLAGEAGVLLRALLRPGSGAQGTLAASLRRAAQQALQGELRGVLLEALTALEGGPLRSAVVRALAGLELEQLQNLARREFGEPLHWSFPVPDGLGWTTAHLYARRRSGQRDGEEGAGEESFRLSVGVDFSHLGPIRADLSLRPGTLAIRLRVSNPAIAERLRAERGALEEALGQGQLRVLLAIEAADAADVELEREAHDIALLRENRLMDVEG